jgi:hypothetical protein
MVRRILKIAVALLLVALIWKLVLGGDEVDEIDKIE